MLPHLRRAPTAHSHAGRPRAHGCRGSAATPLPGWAHLPSLCPPRGGGASRETSLRSRGSPSVQTPVPGPQLPLPRSQGASPDSSPSSASNDCEAQRLGPRVKMKMVLIPTLRAPGPRPPKAGANHCDISTSLCDMGGCSHTRHCPAPFLHLRCLPSLSACRTPTQPARPRPECPSPPPAPPSLLWLPGHPRLPAATRPLCCDLLRLCPAAA